MQEQHYPREISPDELDLAFQRLLIDGIGSMVDGEVSCERVPVVARVLSPSDIVIKIYDLRGQVRYSHERWGYVKEIGSPRSCSWHEMSIPVEDPRVLIFDPRMRIEHAGYRDDVVGVPFQYQLA